MKANSLEELVTNSNIAGELRDYTDWHTRLVRFAQLVADWQEEQEEPDKSLEEEIAEYFSGWKNDSEYGQAIIVETSQCVSVEDCKDIARHFAEWQASQMPMPEDTVLFNKGVAEGRRLERGDLLKDAVEATVENWNPDPHPEITIPLNPDEFVSGDKVRIVVLKEEEK